MTEHSDTTHGVGGSNFSVSSLHLQRIRRAVARLADQGFRVLRVHPHDKKPVDPSWPEKATNDENILDEWFKTPFNIGVACGPQFNEINLVVIDVDTRDDGLQRWMDLCDKWGIPITAEHRTPSGGTHVFFDSPVPLSNGKLCPGIDVRGLGGQVVVPPSIGANGVEYQDAGWMSALGDHPVAPMPQWLIDMLVKAPIERPKPPQPSTNGGVLQNADWFRQHWGWDWLAVLEAQGYDIVKQVGDEVYLRHPTATAEWSCVVHLEDNWMVAYSTNMPNAWRPAQTNRDGSISWTPYDWFVVTIHNGDRSAAAREVNARRGPFQAEAAASRAVSAAAPAEDALYPPREFYDQRPWMAACRQMAEAVGGSPAAHLLAFMTRWATLIPPGYSIPPINGAPSSFDLLSVIAGTSGSGKTSPMRNAEEMLPVQRKDLRLGLGIGSGEGIIEAFYDVVAVERDDGKVVKERRKCIAGVNFAVSEGLIFAELAGRGGTTHVTRLCDAWSGASLSTANASAETFRHIPVNQYRLTLVMGIQATQAHELMTESAASQGFVGRLLFAWAEEPRVSPRPSPPDPFLLAVPPRIGMGDAYLQTYLSYPPEVYAEIQAASDQRVGSNVPVEEHHHDLIRCKVAGILALMEGRTAVNGDDWSIATALVAYSAMVRSHLYSMRRSTVRDQRHNQAEARGEAEYVAESAKERRSIIDFKAKVLTRLRGGSAPFGTKVGLGQMVDGTKRPLLRRAVAELVGEGAVLKVGDRYELAP